VPTFRFSLAMLQPSYQSAFRALQLSADAAKSTSQLTPFLKDTYSQARQYGIARGRWLTARDDLTCEFCGPLDQLVFSFDQLPFGGPPLHDGCRCCLVNDITSSETEGRAHTVLAQANYEDQVLRMIRVTLSREKGRD
jgi:hypothetical protein